MEADAHGDVTADAVKGGLIVAVNVVSEAIECGHGGELFFLCLDECIEVVLWWCLGSERHGGGKWLGGDDGGADHASTGQDVIRAEAGGGAAGKDVMQPVRDGSEAAQAGDAGGGGGVVVGIHGFVRLVVCLWFGQRHDLIEQALGGAVAVEHIAEILVGDTCERGCGAVAKANFGQVLFGVGYFPCCILRLKLFKYPVCGCAQASQAGDLGGGVVVSAHGFVRLVVRLGFGQRHDLLEYAARLAMTIQDQIQMLVGDAQLRGGGAIAEASILEVLFRIS